MCAWGPGSAVGQEIRHLLGCDVDLVQAVFRPDSFVGLPVAEQADLFVSLTQKDADISEVCRRHLSDLVPAETLPTTMKGLDDLEQTARDARPTLKKRLADLEKKSVAEATSAVDVETESQAEPEEDDAEAEAEPVVVAA